MPHVPLIDELAVIACVGVLVTVLLARLKLPTVAGLLVAGASVGPYGFQLVRSIHAIEVLAEIGVVLLLFTIGLEFSFERIKGILKTAALGGLLQVGLTVAVICGVAVAFKQTIGQGIFYGFVFALSSTAIVLRSLSDNGSIDAPHGRLIVGTLIFQDLCVIPMVLIVPLLAPTASSGNAVLTIGLALGKAALVIAAMIGASRFVVPRLLSYIDASGSREIFLLSILGLCIGTSWITAAAGLSLALGAFLSGMIVADTEFGHRAMGDLVPLRDTFVSLFFVSLGMLFDVRIVFEQPMLVAALLMGFLFVKGLLATIAALAMKFPARVAWLTGVGLAQFGEFGFVLVRMAQTSEIVSEQAMRPLLAAGIASMFLTPLLVRVAPRIRLFEHILSPLEKIFGSRDEVEAYDKMPSTLKDHVIIVGFGLAGRLTARALRDANIPYVVLDLNVKTVTEARNAGEPIFYNDATNLEALHHAHLSEARALVLVMNDPQASVRVADAAKRVAQHVPILMRTRFALERNKLLAQGAKDVIVEEVESGLRVAERTLESLGLSRVNMTQEAQVLRHFAEDDATHATLARRN